MSSSAHQAYPFSVQVDGRTYEAVRSVSGTHRRTQSVSYGGRWRLDLRSYLPSDVSVMLPIARLILRDMVTEDRGRSGGLVYDG
jgi:hypothetical protein